MLESCDIYYYHDSLQCEAWARHIKNLLSLSTQRFVDMLNEPSKLSDGSPNKRHLITTEEECFRQHEKYGKGPFFTKENIFLKNLVAVELEELELWLDDNYHLLRINNVKTDENDKEATTHKERITELRNATQKDMKDGKKGAIASEMASTIRVAVWKEAYIPAMVKAAVQLGKEGMMAAIGEKRQRKDLAALLDKYAVEGKPKPSDCSEVIEIFHASLPKGYVDNKGGAPKSKVTQIKQ